MTQGSPVTRMNSISESHKIMNSTLQLRILLLQESFTLKDVDKWSIPQHANLVSSNKSALLVSSLPELEALETKSKLTTLYYSIWVRWRLKEYDVNNLASK